MVIIVSSFIVGLLQAFLGAKGLQKRNLQTLGNEKDQNTTTTSRKKRMVNIGQDVLICPIKSMLGMGRKERPFTCQVNQVPLLAIVSMLSFLFSCFLGCCCCPCFRRGCCSSRKEKRYHNDHENLASSKRDVVMIRA